MPLLADQVDGNERFEKIAWECHFPQTLGRKQLDERLHKLSESDRQDHHLASPFDGTERSHFYTELPFGNPHLRRNKRPEP